VGKERILQLAEQGAVPRGTPVQASSTRPRGIALVGVSGLGLGVQDGDVITRVAGVPVSSRGQVVRLVTAAYDARAPAISAEIWRGPRRFSLFVELPQLDPQGNLQQEPKP
jgi:S1-C subfamily serine protease